MIKKLFISFWCKSLKIEFWPISIKHFSPNTYTRINLLISVTAQLENIKHYLNSCINVAVIPADRNFSISLFANLLGIPMRQLDIFSLYLHLTHFSPVSHFYNPCQGV